jgi:hypothetical protein
VQCVGLAGGRGWGKRERESESRKDIGFAVMNGDFQTAGRDHAWFAELSVSHTNMKTHCAACKCMFSHCTSEFRAELTRLASVVLDVLLACKETPPSPTKV